MGAKNLADLVKEKAELQDRLTYIEELIESYKETSEISKIIEQFVKFGFEKEWNEWNTFYGELCYVTHKDGISFEISSEEKIVKIFLKGSETIEPYRRIVVFFPFGEQDVVKKTFEEVRKEMNGNIANFELEIKAYENNIRIKREHFKRKFDEIQNIMTKIESSQQSATTPKEREKESEQLQRD